jgi:hypothetical protein
MIGIHRQTRTDQILVFISLTDPPYRWLKLVILQPSRGWAQVRAGDLKYPKIEAVNRISRSWLEIYSICRSCSTGKGKMSDN